MSQHVTAEFAVESAVNLRYILRPQWISHLSVNQPAENYTLSADQRCLLENHQKHWMCSATVVFTARTELEKTEKKTLLYYVLFIVMSVFWARWELLRMERTARRSSWTCRRRRAMSLVFLNICGLSTVSLFRCIMHNPHNLRWIWPHTYGDASKSSGEACLFAVRGRGYFSVGLGSLVEKVSRWKVQSAKGKFVFES